MTERSRRRSRLLAARYPHALAPSLARPRASLAAWSIPDAARRQPRSSGIPPCRYIRRERIRTPPRPLAADRRSAGRRHHRRGRRWSSLIVLGARWPAAIMNLAVAAGLGVLLTSIVAGLGFRARRGPPRSARRASRRAFWQADVLRAAELDARLRPVLRVPR